MNSSNKESLEIEAKKETLRKFPLFSELSIEQFRKITSIAKVVKFKKNHFIFFDGDLYKGFYILLKGTVKISKITNDGKESVLHIIKPLNAFADVPLFEGGNYPANSQTLEESIVIFISKEGFLSLIKEDPEMSLRMICGFAKRLRELTYKIEKFSSKEVINRLAEYLLKEIKTNNTDKLDEPFLRLSVPKNTIAAYLGTVSETLSRNFNKLQKDEIIKVKGKTIIILDYPRLKKLAV